MVELPNRWYIERMESMEMVTVVGTIDGLPAEMDYDPTDDGVPVEGRIELNRHTWRELDPRDESDRKLIDRFEESN